MKILFLDTTHPSLKSKLERSGFLCEEDIFSSKAEIEKKISGYQGVVLRSRINIDKQFLDYFSKQTNQSLFIARVGAGMEHIDVEYAKTKNIICISSPEGNRNAVAEHELGMLLALLNNITKANNEVKEGKWLRESNRGTELEGKTIGIIGYGNTGSAFAKILRGFDVNIFAYDKYKKNFENDIVQESSVEEITEKADILSLHLPLTDETKYMVDNVFIEKFKKSIYLLNTSRGPIVETEALVAKLKSLKILGACLDVLEYEETSFEQVQLLGLNSQPEALKYLRSCNNVILTPHIAGWSFQSTEKMAVILAERILAFVAGKK